MLDKQEDLVNILDLKEKELLLESIDYQKELLGNCHHRIKNNLLTLKGLIKIQRRFGCSCDEIINSSLISISSIALIHENLYSNSNSEGFVLFSSFLNDFIINVKEVYDEFNIHFTTDVKKDVMIHEDQLYNLAFILNELIILSTKYSFKDLNKNEVFISLSYIGDKCILNYTDSNNFNHSNDCLNDVKLDNLKNEFAFFILESLVKQMRGVYKFNSLNSIEVVLEFPRLYE